MIASKLEKLAIIFIFFSFLSSESSAQDEKLVACKVVLLNEPDDAFCRGYEKGYEAASTSTTTTLSDASGTYEINGRFKYGVFEPKNPMSGTAGQMTFDPFMVTLPPNYRELLEAGDSDWATISDPNTTDGSNTTVQIDLGDGSENPGSLKLKQSIGIEAFIQGDAAKRQAIESLKPYIKELGPETIGTQILVREAPEAN